MKMLSDDEITARRRAHLEMLAEKKRELEEKFGPEIGEVVFAYFYSDNDNAKTESAEESLIRTITMLFVTGTPESVEQAIEVLLFILSKTRDDLQSQINKHDLQNAVY